MRLPTESLPRGDAMHSCVVDYPRGRVSTHALHGRIDR